MTTKNDPLTGHFAKGNPGRAKGTKNTRTVQWEELGHEIMEGNAERFNELLGRLWDSPDVAEQLRAAELFLKMAEFFKPKLQRIQMPPDRDVKIYPPLVVENGMAKIPDNWPGPIIRFTSPGEEHGDADHVIRFR